MGKKANISISATLFMNFTKGNKRLIMGNYPIVKLITLIVKK